MTAAVVYAVLFLLALVPGLPIGFLVFGRRHAAGWIAGGVLGYFLTSLALWIPIRAGLASPLTFVLSWIAVAALSCWTARTRDAAITLPAWRARDTRLLGAVLLLVLAIAIPPFGNVGAVDRAGHRQYRAYFTADFVWHAALSAEMAKFSSPPRNPYLASRPIHYYWTYFLLPASTAGVSASMDARLQTLLRVNAIGMALLFTSMIFMAAWTAVPRSGAVACAVALAIAASSAEGLFALSRLWARGAPLAAVRDLNIDAISNWWFGGLRVDGLQRCFWWVPQHSVAYALGLAALSLVNAAGSALPWAAVMAAGLALAGSTAMNPFVGGIFSIVFGAAAALDAVRHPDTVRRLGRCAVAGLFVVAAVGWCAANAMVEGAGSALQFGLLGDARNHPVLTLLLSLGPALLTAVVGAVATVRLRSSGDGPARFASAFLLAIGSLILMYFVRLDVDTSWVGFRAGQMFLVAVPPLIAAGFASTGRLRVLAVSVAIAALIAGLPTTAIDLFNAQDVTNRADGPGFKWTVLVTPAEHEALEWLRTNTPVTAIVQMDPLARGRETWSLIPSFAQRRMAAGLPISLLKVPEYDEKSQRVRTMYETRDAREAWTIARSLRIAYVYADDVERRAYPDGVAKFDTAPQLFSRVFANSEARVYRVE